MSPCRETTFDIVSHAMFIGVVSGIGLVLFLCFCGASFNWPVLASGGAFAVASVFYWADQGFRNRRLKDAGIPTEPD